jgi:hypothetical protein
MRLYLCCSVQVFALVAMGPPVKVEGSNYSHFIRDAKVEVSELTVYIYIYLLCSIPLCHYATCCLCGGKGQVECFSTRSESLCSIATGCTRVLEVPSELMSQEEFLVVFVDYHK